MKVETWCGDIGGCNPHLGGGGSRQHVVKFYNWKTFVVTFKCDGSINRDPPMAEFDPASHPSVTPTKWPGQIKVPRRRSRMRPGTKHMDHVGLKSAGKPGRTETVFTDVRATWYKGGPHSFSLSFEVST